MSVNGEETPWKCGKSGGLTFQRASTIVRDIGDPCFLQSPIKVVKAVQISRMLKPEKWEATFDNDGKVFGFHRVLKLIVLGGVDPAIRSEVWEFLLGCYTLSSTTEHRKQLRAVRREKYKDLIKQCQMMHSSIGTGSLAYVVGSKVMDMRTSSKDERDREAEFDSSKGSDANPNTVDNNGQDEAHCIGRTYSCQRGSSIDSGGVVSVRDSMEKTAIDSSLGTCGPNRLDLHDSLSEANREDNVTEACLENPPLPVAELLQKNKKNKKTRRSRSHDDRQLTRHKLGFRDERMHSFQISNNTDLVVELYSSPSKIFSHPIISEVEAVTSAESRTIVLSNNLYRETEMLNRLNISDTSETLASHGSTSQGEALNEDRVSEWLWTLHRIVVDVVRTDSHLQFYENTRNLARMSDILAVYAWVYPATGYCQGMSDILSPFVVLFEDNADAFWCFEMLLRRMRENFQIEGPTGVMKQLQVLWHILELTDKEMFAHLSRIGAESLHFAFRMLLVLFRRELSFDEALCMWEMIWAADFDECMALKLEEYCPELLLLQASRKSAEGHREERKNNHGSDDGLQSNNEIMESSLSESENDGIRSSPYPFCGFAKNLWSRNKNMQTGTLVVTRKSGDDDLAVFVVAAILVLNRQKIIRETRSIDDLIKIFNDNLLKIRVKRCVRTAIKLRKKYFFKKPTHRSA